MAQAAKLLGFHPRAKGRVIEMCADIIIAHAKSSGRPVVRYGKLDAASIRAIRRSQSKIISIAAEHGISEAMVCAVRARNCYKWVE